jgi:hypothetical protein
MLFVKKAKRKVNFPEIDISPWALEASQEFKEHAKEYILRGVNEVLEQVVKDGIDVSVSDTGTIDVCLPLGGTESAEPAWEFSLSELVREMYTEAGPDYEEETIEALRRELQAALNLLDELENKFSGK